MCSQNSTKPPAGLVLLSFFSYRKYFRVSPPPPALYLVLGLQQGTPPPAIMGPAAQFEKEIHKWLLYMPDSARCCASRTKGSGSRPKCEEGRGAGGSSVIASWPGLLVFKMWTVTHRLLENDSW